MVSATAPRTRVVREGHPALRESQEERAEHLGNRIADRITDFAGSMRFVYAHIVWFGLWILINVGALKFLFGNGFDPFPFGFLTMIVSLEAIFLSTFVMISQNRADERRQVLADHQWELIQEEDKQNRLLIQISQQILDLTAAIHDVTVKAQADAAAHRGQSAEPPHR
ncbi:MAG TPA: DUF1003 domain-containing protein [Candidatus Limnocylindrales bacterium]|nr:DUF1003 domain-containing protein [Candidatus Limnocylindrales bacterium]